MLRSSGTVALKWAWLRVAHTQHHAAPFCLLSDTLWPAYSVKKFHQQRKTTESTSSALCSFVFKAGAQYSALAPPFSCRHAALLHRSLSQTSVDISHTVDSPSPQHRDDTSQRKQVQEVTAKSLTHMIKKARSIHALAQLWRKHSSRFDSIHVSAALLQLKALHSETSSSHGVLDHEGQELLLSLLHLLVQPQFLHTCGSWALANTIYSLAYIPGDHSKWLPVLAGELAVQHLPRFKLFNQNSTAQGLSNCIWALAKLRYGSCEQWGEFASTAIDCIQPGKAVPRDFANTHYAFGLMQYYHVGWCEHLEAAIANGCLKGSVARDVVNILWGCARINHKLKGSTSEILKQVLLTSDRKLIDNMDKQELCNSLWAMTVLDLVSRHSDLADALIEKVNSFSVGDFSHKELAQLGLVHLSLMVEGSHTRQPLDSFLVDAALVRLQSDKRTTSACQHDVYGTATKMQAAGLFGIVEAHVEYAVPALEHAISVDILLKLEGGQEVVIEIDGTQHFIMNLPGHYTGATVLRNRLLHAVYQPSNVHFFINSWDMELMDAAKVQALCRLLGWPAVQLPH